MLVEQQFAGPKMLLSGAVLQALGFGLYVFPVYGLYLAAPRLLFFEEFNPLFLPRYSIRVILVLAFAGLAVYLYRQNRLFEPQALSVLGVVFAYFLGVVLRFGRFRLWKDLKAVVVLLVLLYTAGAYLANRPDFVPYQLRDITLGLVLFYFGSRE